MHKAGTLSEFRKIAGRMPAPRLQDMLRLLGGVGIARDAWASKRKAGPPSGFIKNSWPKASSWTTRHEEIGWHNWNYKRNWNLQAFRLQGMLRLFGYIEITREAWTLKHKAGTPSGLEKNSCPKASSQTTRHAEIVWQNWNYKRSWGLETQSWEPLIVL